MRLLTIGLTKIETFHKAGQLLIFNFLILNDGSNKATLLSIHLWLTTKILIQYLKSVRQKEL